MHGKYAQRKARLFADLPGDAVEIGAGVGANLRYLPPGSRLLAIEPNVRMHRALREKARRMQIELEVLPVMAEATDLASESVDFVYCTLVLCSVDEPLRCLREVKRILRPRGRFACIEHVIAPERSIERAAQRTLARPWRWLFEGCDLCRDTPGLIASAGFSHVELDRFRLATALLPIAHQIQAVCTK